MQHRGRAALVGLEYADDFADPVSGFDLVAYAEVGPYFAVHDGPARAFHQYRLGVEPPIHSRRRSGERHDRHYPPLLHRADRRAFGTIEVDAFVDVHFAHGSERSRMRDERNAHRSFRKGFERTRFARGNEPERNRALPCGN